MDHYHPRCVPGDIADVPDKYRQLSAKNRKPEGEQSVMEELRAILLAHAKRYPLMQPTDAVKLIFQNEFGGGHLIRDEQTCLNYLRQEYASTEKDPTAALYEDIGNGIVRVNLAAVKPEDLEKKVKRLEMENELLRNFLRELERK